MKRLKSSYQELQMLLSLQVVLLAQGSLVNRQIRVVPEVLEVLYHPVVQVCHLVLVAQVFQRLPVVLVGLVDQVNHYFRALH